MTVNPSGTAGEPGVAVEVLDHAVAVRPVGEIDLATSPHLSHALAEALRHASAPKPVVLDCSRLTFCDSAGLNALLVARRAAQDAGVALHLDSPNDQLQRLLDISGTLPLFPVNQIPSHGTPR
ncbi:STAS domain-containing protein [Streptomyces sp. NPDC058646]|uniref:STAS domain-containing protein n=1 Tax=Streptomyces sp. NPDC058646 TaxID=3346574 RepID=UPI00365E9254